MKALIVRGSTTDLLWSLPTISYPGWPVTHLVLPEHDVTITPYSGTFFVNPASDLLKKMDESPILFETEVVELDAFGRHAIENFLDAHRLLAHRLTEMDAQLSEAFKQQFHQERPESSTISKSSGR